MDSLKAPVPEPFAFWVTPLSPIVGVASVEEYTTPLAVTVAPPSDVTLPPMVAVDAVYSMTPAVVTVGAVPALVTVMVTSAEL
jgi:hypothetical protein